MSWDFSPPEISNLSDHDVFTRSDLLKNKKIALIICGGIAAMKSPLLARELRRHQANVTIYTSDEALRYTTLDSLEWSSNNPVVSKLSANAEHLNSTDFFDCYLIAPATYNTINKMALGIADNVVSTTMVSAIGNMEQGKSHIIIAPTMHGSMHNSILTENMKKLHQMGVHFIKPRQEFGKNNLPNAQNIVAQCIRRLNGHSLSGKKYLVTAGNTPVPIDSIRRITTIFKGKLGIEIAKELYYRGADVDLIISGSDLPIPSYIKAYKANSYDSYKNLCISLSKSQNYDTAIFSAAVADFMPSEVFDGKIKSNIGFKQIDLKVTEKVIDIYHSRFPMTKIISFKYEEKVSHDELINIAKNRINKGHLAVVANRCEDKSDEGDQKAYLVSDETHTQSATDKKSIAKMICNFMEMSV